MSPETLIPHQNFVPLSVAVTLVSYSRDYIGRLAREGKIISQQIDKQWFVSRESLVNFFEKSELEDSVKKRILSLSRKNDLEVKDFYSNAVANITERQTQAVHGSLFFVTLIIFGGLVSGSLLHTNAPLLFKNSDATVTQLLSTLRIAPNQAGVLQAIETADISFSDVVLIEDLDSIPMAGGIVLFPTVGTADAQTVETLFSDEVTVIVTSTTTGFVRSADGVTELPFVRVPQDPTL